MLLMVGLQAGAAADQVLQTTLLETDNVEALVLAETSSGTFEVLHLGCRGLIHRIYI